mmetsp:Transcript_39925/g.91998  ORF Transcript_39925/g.91998 Transcript_39925/m.91998 type:complete len:108 (+) Transcript_39925:89-412(+)
MANRSRSNVLPLLFALAVAAYVSMPTFVTAPSSVRESEIISYAPAAVAATGALPLAVSQPAFAYDSVVSYLQAWLFGGTFLVIFFVLVLVASIANPLTLRREEAERL